MDPELIPHLLPLLKNATNDNVGGLKLHTAVKYIYFFSMLPIATLTNTILAIHKVCILH